MSLVSFVKIQNPNNQMSESIRYSLDLIQYSFPKSVRNVVIKPNMCYYWEYTTGQTTDPKFVAALVDMIRSRAFPNARFSIVESDASAMKCRYAFKMLGYEKIAQKHEIDLINLSEDESDRVKVTVGGESFVFMMPRTIQNADLKVNVPKIKLWGGHTKITCALKNIYGCNPYPDKFRYHRKLDEVIVGLNKVMKFDLCVVDGNIVSGVEPRRLGLVMASRDPVALDVAAAKIAGLNPKSIRHVMLANQEGLGNTSYVPIGNSPKYFEKRYPRKQAKNKVMELAFKFIKMMGLETRLGL